MSMSAQRLREPSRLAFWFRVAMAALGTALAVGFLEMTALLRQQPYGLIPFVTSIALVMGLPDAPASQPRALIGGHVISTLVGYAVVLVAGSSPVTAAIGAGLAVGAMLGTRTMHPPAGIDPFLIVHDALGLRFLLETVLPGALLLAGFAWAWHRIPVVSASMAAARLRPFPFRSRVERTEDRAPEPRRRAGSDPHGIARDDGSGG